MGTQLRDLLGGGAHGSWSGTAARSSEPTTSPPAARAAPAASGRLRPFPQATPCLPAPSTQMAGGSGTWPLTASPTTTSTRPLPRPTPHLPAPPAQVAGGLRARSQAASPMAMPQPPLHATSHLPTPLAWTSVPGQGLRARTPDLPAPLVRTQALGPGLRTAASPALAAPRATPHLPTPHARTQVPGQGS